MLSKPCRKCNGEKPLSNFHRDATRTDGHKSVCKSCHTAEVRDWRNANRDRYRAVQRTYTRTTPRGTAQQRAAHHQVERAVLAGALTRPDSCPRCGSQDSPIQGHHEDYSRPLHVDWMCAMCHARHHRGGILVGETVR